MRSRMGRGQDGWEGGNGEWAVCKRQGERGDGERQGERAVASGWESVREGGKEWDR